MSKSKSPVPPVLTLRSVRPDGGRRNVFLYVQTTSSPGFSATDVRPVVVLRSITLPSFDVQSMSVSVAECRDLLGEVPRRVRRRGRTILARRVAVRGGEEELVVRVGDVAGEAELLRGRVRRQGDLLAHRDRAARRRRVHVVREAEHVRRVRWIGDPLDVVAVEVVGRAAQRAEPVGLGSVIGFASVPPWIHSLLLWDASCRCSLGQGDRRRAVDGRAGRLTEAVEQRDRGLRE